MPAIHYQNFDVYFYECDAYGFLQNIAYLRWMQEAAFGASAAVGFDFARYNALDHLWLVRETELELLQPVRYGETIEVKTYVRDFQRFRSRRVYEFRNPATKEKIARANTNWVYVNAQSLRPTKIPVEIQAAFFPEGLPAEDKGRQRFPILSEPAGQGFSVTRTVGWHEIDQIWHVNNAMYLRYLEEAADYAHSQCGWPVDRMQNHGFRILPIWQHLEYRLPAVLGDELETVTWLSSKDETSVLRAYQLQRVSDGALLLQAQIRFACRDLETGERLPIPAEFLRDLEANSVIRPC